MILKLAKAFNPGDADPGKSYDYLHIDIISYNSSAFSVAVVYDLGNLDANSVYVPGAASPRITEMVSPDELLAFASAISPSGEPALITTQRLSYQFLIDHRGITGSIDLTLPKDPPAAAPAPAQPSPQSSVNPSSNTSNSTPTSTSSATSSSTDPSASSSTSSGSSSTGP